MALPLPASRSVSPSAKVEDGLRALSIAWLVRMTLPRSGIHHRVAKKAGLNLGCDERKPARGGGVWGTYNMECK
jgi:hypothetical protein